MSELISNPSYWQRRLREAQRRERLWEAVFLCPEQRWLDIEAKHKQILAKLIAPGDSILDCACGYGRLPDLLPTDVYAYVGIDISQDFINLARQRFPDLTFARADLTDLTGIRECGGRRYDWAVLISVRPMIIRHLGQATWDTMEKEIRSVANRILYLEYDPTDDGSVE